jgi:hypothetical protein
MTGQESKRWYQEPWVWLLIAFPLSAVIGGFFTLYLAIISDDGLVVDDYYKRGKTINRDLARDAAAARYHAEASLALDLSGNALRLKLGAINGTWPGSVRLSLLHPTRAGKDQALVLPHGNEGNYRGRINELTQGHWYVQLEADDWRLSGTLQVPQVAPLVLVPIK